MHDINGGTWVYENTAAHTYVRRRVQVRYVVDDLAVLETGGPPSAQRSSPPARWSCTERSSASQSDIGHWSLGHWSFGFMSWLVSTSLRLRVAVLALSCLLIVYGIRTLRTTPLDVFPEFAPPLVEIQTEAPGISTEEVESMITMPLENALNGTPWKKIIRTKSVLGLSSVVLIFEDGTDLIRARQLVQERLATEASRLPAIARQPVILSPLSSTSRAMKIGVTSKKLSQMEMTELARWTIRPRLMAVPGVANVAIWGQRDRQFQVIVDPERLQAHDVTLGTIERAAAEAVTLEGGGFIDTPNQRLAVRQQVGIYDAEDLGNVKVDFRGGTPLRLRDVADVIESYPPPIGDAVIGVMGSDRNEPGLLLIVEKQPWGNTLEVTHKVEAALERSKPGLQGPRNRSDDLPPGDVHRAIALQPVACDGRRLRPGGRDSVRVSVRLADGHHQPDGHSAVADRRRPGAALPRRHAEHDGHRRPGDRAGRSRR